MFVKPNANNQFTLPEAILQAVPAAEYFEVTIERGRIVLTPVQVDSLAATYDKLAQLGITEEDVDDAVRWARMPACGS